jgi:hypothetical protein
LALQLKRLGQDLREERVGADELERRLAELERALAQEYARRLQLWREQKAPAGAPGVGSAERDATGEESSDAPGGGPTAERPGEEGEDEARTPPDAQGLAEALDLLRGMREESFAGERTADAEGQTRGEATGAGEGEGAGPDSELQEGRPGSSRPGSSPVQDVQVPGQEIATPEGGEALKAAADLGEGEMARLLVRALPQSGDATIAEEQVLGEYRRQAESALAGEQVPYDLRGYVREYFLRLGVLGEE